jgi:hypothetical protein
VIQNAFTNMIQHHCNLCKSNAVLQQSSEYINSWSAVVDTSGLKFCDEAHDHRTREVEHEAWKNNQPLRFPISQDCNVPTAPAADEKKESNDKAAFLSEAGAREIKNSRVALALGLIIQALRWLFTTSFRQKLILGVCKNPSVRIFSPRQISPAAPLFPAIKSNGMQIHFSLISLSTSRDHFVSPTVRHVP